MSAKRPRKLVVEVSAAGPCVHVPSARGGALLAYLRSHGVAAAPPEPCTTDVDAIALAKSTDVKAVQALLNRWA
jgi:hypothetical protein